MTDTQKKLLTYGVPIVVVIGLLVWLRSRNSSPTATSGTALAGNAAGDTAIGLGQLADFENSIGAQIASLGAQVSALQAGSGTTTVSSPNTPGVPSPAGVLINPGGPIQPGAAYALSPTAAQAAITGGMTVYQTGAEALAWATAHGGSTAGIDPTQIYALSGAAAAAAVSGGMPVYQTGTEALAWLAAHPS